jgi:cytochrome c biogenesis protein
VGVARAAASEGPRADRLARRAERLLRLLGDARLGLALLFLAILANVSAALLPDGQQLLRGWPYSLLLGAVALTAVASVAVRAPAAWREWWRPGPVRPGIGAVEWSVPPAPPEQLAQRLAGAGYRVRVERSRRGWAVHGVRRGWSRFAGQASHLALVLIVVGAAVGAAFGSELTFSLLPGDQSLLDAPRPGFSAAVRLDRLDAEFGTDGRPRRLDVDVTFLDGGEVVRSETLKVNEPGSFDGYLVHAWTYGPAARLRVESLAGAPLLDAAVPLDQESGGRPSGSIELPSADVVLGLALVDAVSNELGVSALRGSSVVGLERLRPGEAARIGPVVVRLEAFDAWVTFLSRRDPGLGVLFAGGALLAASLAVAFWLPRRRVTLRPSADGAGGAGGVVGVVRGERFDRPSDEAARLRRHFAP